MSAVRQSSPPALSAVPRTEGIKYAGSKLKMLPHILHLVGKTDARSVFDGFSGTTRVSQALAKCGRRVVANDVAVWSETFARCYLLGDPSRRAEYEELVAHLNHASPRDGWYTERYGGDPDSTFREKRPWQRRNTRKLDGVREEIDRLELDDGLKAVALTSLILALDQVDSTLGHFASYLRDWSPRSYKSLHLEVPRIVGSSGERHEVWRRDVFDLAPAVEADLAYYDPPYGSNNEKMPPSRVRYAAYYHLWTTICLNDRPSIFGKANRRVDSSDKAVSSPFEEFRRGSDGKFMAVEALRRLLQSTRAPHILLSYSSGGRATTKELDEAISSCGRLREVLKVDHKRNVMAGMKWTNEWVSDADQPNQEFLFLIEKA